MKREIDEVKKYRVRANKDKDKEVKRVEGLIEKAKKMRVEFEKDREVIIGKLYIAKATNVLDESGLSLLDELVLGLG